MRSISPSIWSIRPNTPLLTPSSFALTPTRSSSNKTNAEHPSLRTERDQRHPPSCSAAQAAQDAALSGLMVRGGAAASARRRRGSVGRRHIGDNKCAAVLLDTFDETLVNVAQLGVDRLLPLNVLSVQPGNHLSSRLLA